ncbi:MAG: division/cell wall cluster transcriptional repressor MraZ [Deltaproteobacteria bacterium]|nr:division/cell wall cluster transcriptional repressor MraZ [Deltaproteobacteria bacterium]
MFRGRHKHTIDAKGRLSIPAGYRMELQKRSDQPPILTGDQKCLRLYPAKDWCGYEKKIVAEAAVDPDAQDFVRLVVSSAVEAPIDKQGRILVPQYLREQAHIQKDVTLAGVGQTVELWDTARLAEHLDLTQANFREISSGIAEKLRS